jgi:hypothetical protein
MSTAELAVSYAALILADDGVEITVRAVPYPLPPENEAIRSSPSWKEEMRYRPSRNRAKRKRTGNQNGFVSNALRLMH